MHAATVFLDGANAVLILMLVALGLAIVFGLGVALAMGLLTERLVIHPLRNASRVTLLVGTAGVALAAVALAGRAD